ncbi:MAG: GxxExxY protein [bacterium]|nr:GxxExxY protein [bacterium]
MIADNLIYKDVCYELDSLGSACSERQYQDALEFKLNAMRVNFEREKDLLFKLKEGSIAGNRADFVVDDKVVIDLKAKKEISRDDFKQMLRYLRAGEYKLGLIVNFGSSKVITQRVINANIRI